MEREEKRDEAALGPSLGMKYRLERTRGRVRCCCSGSGGRCSALTDTKTARRTHAPPGILRRGPRLKPTKRTSFNRPCWSHGRGERIAFRALSARSRSKNNVCSGSLSVPLTDCVHRYSARQRPSAVG